MTVAVPIPPVSAPLDVLRNSSIGDATSIYQNQTDQPFGALGFGDTWSFVFNQNPAWSAFWSAFSAWANSIQQGLPTVTCGGTTRSIGDWICYLNTTVTAILDSAVFYLPDRSIDVTGVGDIATGNGLTFSVVGDLQVIVGGTLEASIYGAAAGILEGYIGSNGLVYPLHGNSVDVSTASEVGFYANGNASGAFVDAAAVPGGATSLYVGVGGGAPIQVLTQNVVIGGIPYVLLGWPF